MKEIIVKNKEILKILKEFEWFYENRDVLKDVKPNCPDSKAEDYISDEYRLKIEKMGAAHDGYPEKLQGYNLRDYHDKMFLEDNSKSIPKEFKERFDDLRERIMTELSVRNSAVATLYPPKGFISWHTNANATGFNLIFTWSETGEGWFDYIDENKERVHLPDRKGEWVCRYGMFGANFQDKYPIVNHAAYTDCWRMTLAFVFSADEAAGGLQEFIIDELSNP